MLGVFFFKQKTAYEMRISDWSSDVCSSDLDTFFEHYQFLIQELLRVTMPGRLHSVHVMQLPMSKIRHGNIGMRDFRGEVIRAYEDAGWIFHSEVCIRSEEHTSELQSLMRISYAVFCLKKKTSKIQPQY